MIPAGLTGIRQLDAVAPGTAPRPRGSSNCPPRTDGWPGVLRAQTARFPSDADAQDAIASTCQVLSVAGDGDHVLVQAFRFGRIDNGAFASLPGTTPRILPVSATW